MDLWLPSNLIHQRWTWRASTWKTSWLSERTRSNLSEKTGRKQKNPAKTPGPWGSRPFGRTVFFGWKWWWRFFFSFEITVMDSSWDFFSGGWSVLEKEKWWHIFSSTLDVNITNWPYSTYPKKSAWCTQHSTLKAPWHKINGCVLHLQPTTPPRVLLPRNLTQKNGLWNG